MLGRSASAVGTWYGRQQRQEASLLMLLRALRTAFASGPGRRVEQGSLRGFLSLPPAALLHQFRRLPPLTEPPVPFPLGLRAAQALARGVAGAGAAGGPGGAATARRAFAGLRHPRQGHQVHRSPATARAARCTYPATDSRPDRRPDVCEDEPALGNLEEDFNFGQPPCLGCTTPPSGDPGLAECRTPGDSSALRTHGAGRPRQWAARESSAPRRSGCIVIRREWDSSCQPSRSRYDLPTLPPSIRVIIECKFEYGGGPVTAVR